MPNNDDQLQQQYQEILNKYASSLTPPPEMPPKPPEPENSNNIPPQSTMPNLEPPVEQSIDQPVSEPQTMSPPPTETKSIISPQPPIVDSVTPPIYFPPQPTPDKPSNLFKYLFYFSILVFVAVAAGVIYNFSTAQQSTVVEDEVPTSLVGEGQFCEFNDKKVAVGESIPSEDSCNTCTCGSDLTMSCTEKACIAPEPTVKVETKIYKDTKYGYQFECPATAKYTLEATSVNGNKIPFKQESCTEGESIATVSVYDNTVVHSFGDLETKVSPDDKYIVTFEGDTTHTLSTFKFL